MSRCDLAAKSAEVGSGSDVAELHRQASVPAIPLTWMLHTPHETTTEWSAVLRPALGVASAKSFSQTSTPPLEVEMSRLVVLAIQAPAHWLALVEGEPE